MMASERRKAKRIKKDIVIESVVDILYYFSDRYAELSSPVQECGALYLELELNKGNSRAESYLQGLALGPMDKTAHPRQSWAIDRLAEYSKRSKGTRRAISNGKMRSLKTKASQIGLPVESETVNDD